MNVTAEKIAEAADMEIVRDGTVTGHAPAAAATPAAAPAAESKHGPAL